MEDIEKILPRTGRAFFRQFPKLRKIQREALIPVINGKNVLIISATGSGKTEAAIAPLVEKSLDFQEGTYCLYVCPTRALVNDITERLNSYFRKVSKETGYELVVGRRTGDKDDTKRVKHPHLLVTTPESLDVMISNNYSHILNTVRAVLIDDVHQLYNTPRGLQLSILLERLKLYTNMSLQRIALSATVANPKAVSTWLTGSDDEFMIILDDKHREIILRFYWVSDNQDLFEIIRQFIKKGNSKILLFANTRKNCEKLSILLQSDNSFKDFIFLHHSSLDKIVREDVESRFQISTCAICIATSTLELGIDIGDIDLILMYRAPYSVSSFLQRMGRGNRRTNMTRAALLCKTKEDLLKFIALSSLASKGELEDRPFIEYFSVIVQQIFSLLNQSRNYRLSKKNLLKLCEYTTFLTERNINDILEKLVEEEYIIYDSKTDSYKMSSKLKSRVGYGKIYGNIPAPKETIKLKSKLRILGEIAAQRLISKNDIISFAGKFWKVKHIAEKQIDLEPHPPVENAKVIKWKGRGFNTPFELANRMKKELIIDPGKNKKYKLDKNSTKVLSNLRKSINLEPDKFNKSIFYFKGENFHRYYTFAGDLCNRILQELFSEAYYPILIESDGAVSLNSNLPLDFSKLPIMQDSVTNILEKNYKKFSRGINPTDYFFMLPEELKKREVISVLNDPRIIDKIRELRESEILKVEMDILNKMDEYRGLI